MRIAVVQGLMQPTWTLSRKRSIVSQTVPCFDYEDDKLVYKEPHPPSNFESWTDKIIPLATFPQVKCEEPREKAVAPEKRF